MFWRKFFEMSDYTIRLSDNFKVDLKEIKLTKTWYKNSCETIIENNSAKDIRIKEIILFQGEIENAENIEFYSEGYNMLSQYGNTFSNPSDIGFFNDHKHYKMPADKNTFTTYQMMILKTGNSPYVLAGFSSCKRFRTEFRITKKRLEVAVCMENLKLKTNDIVKLEDFYLGMSEDKEKLLGDYSESINKNHIPIFRGNSPSGWCSWYCYGPDITEEILFENIEEMNKKIPELEYVLIDDGYQKHMGDWLIQSSGFQTPMEDLCKKIRREGFKPAIWVAPFIAQEESEIFRNNPEYFVKDFNGKPLRSDKVSFGGWRNGPWYMLDGTHPGAKEHLEEVFSVMRNKWGCDYFKLDANVWGAFPFGKRYRENSTSIEAYREGMEAVLKGVGKNSFVLGCNAPMWASLGLVHGMRVSNDIQREWDIIRRTSKECHLRNWQNFKLWINDPDCILMENISVNTIDPTGEKFWGKSVLSENEKQYHLVSVLAAGGIVMSGDRIKDISDSKLIMLKKLLGKRSITAVFDDDSYRIGRVKTDDGYLICLLNSNDTKEKISFKIDGSFDVYDYFSEGKIGIADEIYHTELLGRSARALHFKYRDKYKFMER